MTGAPPPELPARLGLEDGDPRFPLLVAQVADRLRPVCRDWDESRFQALVRQVARVKVRWGEAYRPGARRTDA